MSFAFNSTSEELPRTSRSFGFGKLADCLSAAGAIAGPLATLPLPTSRPQGPLLTTTGSGSRVMRSERRNPRVSTNGWPKYTRSDVTPRCVSAAVTTDVFETFVFAPAEDVDVLLEVLLVYE
jgi:hypothetical protein